MTGARPISRNDVLITVDQLHQLLTTAAPVTLLDARWELAGSRPDDFEAGHIDGAVFVDLERELSDPAVPPEREGRHPLPTAEAFQASCRRWGVHATTPVVVMDAGPSLAASRAWWLLRWFGHTDVRVLDGGFAAWQRAGLPSVAGPVRAPGGGTFVPRPGGIRTVSIDEVGHHDRAWTLLDARAPERFRGEVEPIDPVPGHIPGAVNVPTLDALTGEGTFRSTEELLALFRAAGINPGDDVVTSCGSGVTAGHQVLALALIGVDAGLFPGSYSLWCRTPGLPIGRGER
jgi:thiosulfate/3-mercaptopyruvate sulfurtransferase